MKTKGMIIFTIPVGNIPSENVDKYIKEHTKDLAGIIRKIKSSGYLVIMLPSRTSQDPKIESIHF